ncbi:MAG TPA: hypothetical protein VMB73_33975 [Acetobacteraceae bacterium]|jgi:hypothetical protein|nr:hypothetical protein [Acetobacteraceae bacterium]
MVDSSAVFIIMVGEGPPSTTFLGARCKVVDATFVGMTRWARTHVNLFAC